MGNSRKPGPIRECYSDGLLPSRTPGPLGRNDAADPCVAAVSGDRPGSTSEPFGPAISGRNNIFIAAAGPPLVAEKKQAQAVPRPPAAASVHYLVQAGIDRLNADRLKFPHQFPSDYYDTLCRHLFEVALNANGRNYGRAFSLLNDLQEAKLGIGLQRQYTQIVGTDSANGWDKVRHFAYTAYLEWKSLGLLAPEVFTYGKELWDQIEYYLGMDPEGYSVPDIRADNRGEQFAEEMRGRMIAEIKAEIRREVRHRARELITGIVTGTGRMILREIIQRAIDKFLAPTLPLPRL